MSTDTCTPEIAIVDNTGVSRSGRVRKRSSKFNDYESSEEPEIKKKMSPSKKNFRKAQLMENSSTSSSSSSSSSSSDSDDSFSDDKDDSLEYSDQWSENVNPEQLNEEFEDFPQESQSLYFSEKRKSALDQLGKRTKSQRKTQRKDKGQSRMTAYMIWVKATRSNVAEANPDMDFSALNRRLGEMWALVPPAQKMNWKKKARQLLAKKQKKKVLITTGAPVINKVRQDKPNIPTKGKLQQYYRTIPLPAPNMTITSKQSPRIQKVLSRTSTVQSVNDSSSNPTMTLKVTGTTPHDVAAHLKLLGESLNNIGQKLKEHEDQIAVSGSLSVLLDSMLCVLGPLACLTNQLEETRGAIPEETLAGILDNIAYIMPGIA